MQQPVEAPPVAQEQPPQKMVEEKPRPPEVVIPKKKPDPPKSPKKEQREQITQSTVASTGVAAEQTSVTSPPGVMYGTAASLEEARLNYQEAVASLLSRAKRYPERALRRGVTGEATIRIEIKSDGSLADFAILQSAGATVLDEELRAMVDRAAPFPSFPKDLRRSSLALVVPVAFTIK
jgi:protein TonB